MAADTSEITESNHLDIECSDPDILSDVLQGSPVAPSDHDLLVHVLADLHEALRMLTAQGKLLAKHDALLEEFRPLLERFRSPLASRLPRGRKADG